MCSHLTIHISHECYSACLLQKNGAYIDSLSSVYTHPQQRATMRRPRQPTPRTIRARARSRTRSRAANSTPKHASLLGLPPEVRVAIYKLCLDDLKPFINVSRRSRFDRLHLAFVVLQRFPIQVLKTSSNHSPTTSSVLGHGNERSYVTSWKKSLIGIRLHLLSRYCPHLVDCSSTMAPLT